MKWSTAIERATALETMEIYDLTEEQTNEAMKRFEIAARETPYHTRWAYVAAHNIAAQL